MTHIEESRRRGDLPYGVEVRRVTGFAGSYAEYWRDPDSGHLMMLHSDESDPGFVEWAFIGGGIDSSDPEVKTECQTVERIATQLGATFCDAA